MPFDGAEFAIDDRISTIDQVIGVLSTPAKWCKAAFRTPDGRYCIRGAMRAVAGAEYLKPIVLQAIYGVTRKRYLRIESFNDHPHTRHDDDVLRVLHRARQLVVNGWKPGMAQAGERAGWSALLEVLRASLSHGRASSHPPAG